MNNETTSTSMVHHFNANNGTLSPKSKKTLPTISYNSCIMYEKSKKTLPTISYNNCIMYEKSTKTLPTNINS